MKYINILYSNYDIDIKKTYLIKGSPYPIFKLVTDKNEVLFKVINKKNINQENDNFINYLINKGLCKYEFILNQNNSKYTDIPETDTCFYLRKFLNGFEVDYKDTNNAFYYGQSLALFHNASKEYFCIQRINCISNEIICVLDEILDLMDINYKNKKIKFIKIKDYLNFIQIEDNVIDCIYIHGDTHGGNALLINHNIYFIDLEDIKIYDRRYDIACFYWMCLTTGNTELWEKFNYGYYGNKHNMIVDQTIILFTLHKDLCVFRYYFDKFHSKKTSVIENYIDSRLKFILKILNIN